jgi:hypothetical protein
MSYYNQRCRDDFKTHPNSCIGWYLISSFAYYKEAESLLGDEVFDKVCVYIYNNWDKLEHKYKYLVPKESLTAGTGFDINFNEYPQGLLRVCYKLIGDMK